MASGVKLESYKVAFVERKFGRNELEATLADSYGHSGSLHEAGECSSSGENNCFAAKHSGGGEMYRLILESNNTLFPVLGISLFLPQFFLLFGKYITCGRGCIVFYCWLLFLLDEVMGKKCEELSALG